jgi:TolA-binding protein
VKDWTARRLVESANRAGRFDAAVNAYVALVRMRPSLAIKSRPALPPGQSSDLEAGAKALKQALADSSLQPEERQALRAFLFDIYQAQGEQSAAGEVAEQLLRGRMQGEDPSARGELVEFKLAVARSAMQAKDYRKAISAIEQDPSLFVTPQIQADALYLLAEAKYALATTPDGLKDAALAYMRVVAHFQDAPGVPHVKQALLKTAEILDKLDDPAGAARIRAKLPS